VIKTVFVLILKAPLYFSNVKVILLYHLTRKRKERIIEENKTILRYER